MAAPLLTAEIVDAITAIFPRYPTRRAAVLPALHVINEELGYVPPQAVVESLFAETDTREFEERLKALLERGG